MPNSKYPNQLDTSKEIPPVRDNITEIGSDVINSLRSAIFKIEAALGINPQGASGNTLASRISRTLDENGNILLSALTSANVLSGPIIDADVSKVASIKESKLNLDYPTKLLQSEISIVDSEINLIKEELDALSVLLSIHLEPTALNRHSAIAITVDSSDTSISDLASTDLESGTLQQAMERLYDGHIGYSGNNISDINNSHNASQIYFDNSTVSGTISSSSVQSAIEDLVNIESVGFKDTILNITSNGRVRTGSISDDFESNDKGSLLIDFTTITYTFVDGESRTVFNFPSSSEIDLISEFDILELSGSSNLEDNKDYQIYRVNRDGFDLVQSIIVYGGPKQVSSFGLRARVFKNNLVTYNAGGFCSVSRPRINKTNTPDIQVLNPDSATIISRGFNPTSITASSHTFDISIDGDTPVTIDTFDSMSIEQNIDTVMQRINDQATDGHLNFLAYKVRVAGCSEIALSHNVPNISADTINRTLEVSPGSSDDGTTLLGLSNPMGVVLEGLSGNSLALNGLILSSFGLIKSYTSSDVAIITGTGNITLINGTMRDADIRVGDLVVITGSTVFTDDGSYRISSVTSSTASLELNSFVFGGAMDENSIVHIIRSSANVGEMTFEEIVSTDGSIIFDTFMTQEKDIHFKKRMEVENSIAGGSFFGVISDISKGFITAGQTGTLNINTSGVATLIGPDFISGPPVYVGSTGRYNIFGSDNLSFITIDIKSSSLPLINQTVGLFGFDEISSGNYHLCRGSFSTSLGRILGTSSSPGIPSVVDKRSSGTADATIVGESFIERYIEGPRGEIRSDGVIKGILVSNVSYTDTGSEIFQTFDVGAGVAYVNGIRYEFPGIQNYKIKTGQSFFVVMNENGCINAGPEIANPSNLSENISPFFNQNALALAEVTNDGSTSTAHDLRLFIDNLDLKIIGEVRVSPDSRFGHFKNIASAVNYCRRFSKIFPNIERPSILLENGEHVIDETIILDFDIKISGTGRNSIVLKSGSISLGSVYTGNADASTSAFLIGSDVDTESTNIVNGVTLSNFTYKSNSTNLSNVGVAIALCQPISKSSVDISKNATYVFNNINFVGPTSIDGLVANPGKVGEFALFVGQHDSATLAPISNLEMGNIMFTNNSLSRMGLEIGAVKVSNSASNLFKNIIISNNIFLEAAPNILSAPFSILEYPSLTSTQDVIENSNVTRAS